MMKKLRLVMLVSGSGSTACAIINACERGELTGIEPALVIASEYDIGAIFKVSAKGIRHVVIRRKDYDSQEEFGAALIEVCRRYSIDLVGQYGWMPKTPENFINAFVDMMINQHPGIVIPGERDFGGNGMYGMRVHVATLFYMRTVEFRNPYTEATAQRVAPDFDEGAVLYVERVKILADDTPVLLQKRVLLAEYRVQIKTLQMFGDGTVEELGRDPVIGDRQEAIDVWHKAKRIARTLYPKG